MNQIIVVGYMHKFKDKRVWKTVEILSKEFFVHYVFWEDKPFKYEEIKNVKLYPLKYNYDKNNQIKDIFNRIEYEKNICKTVKRIFTKNNIKYLYIHHFGYFKPFCLYKIAKAKNIKVITDFHEYVAEEYMFSLRNKLPIIPLIGKFIDKKIIEYSDKGIFVSNGIAEHAKNIKSNLKIQIIPNYATNSVNTFSQKQKKIVFVGGNAKRMKKELEILKELNNQGFEIESIGVNLNEKFINYIPFLQYEDMLKKLSESAFSIVSYSPYDQKGNLLKNYVYSMPNKFFDSIAANTPVIIREEFLEMKNFVDKFGVGIVINPDNLRESTEKIISAYEKYDQLIENIKKHKSGFVWNMEKEKTFIDFVVS
ncbi:hypothetical protein LN42_06775 [Marinitoga sp. 1137]|nr:MULTISPECIES: hypothetical protein [Marinitoga]APT76117.1 hypothetical protein LN42_06775 [Marinitoga sp. 1137]